jgi:hypothetical protein
MLLEHINTLIVQMEEYPPGGAIHSGGTLTPDIPRDAPLGSRKLFANKIRTAGRMGKDIGKGGLSTAKFLTVLGAAGLATSGLGGAAMGAKGALGAWKAAKASKLAWMGKQAATAGGKIASAKGTSGKFKALQSAGSKLIGKTMTVKDPVTGQMVKKFIPKNVAGTLGAKAIKGAKLGAGVAAATGAYSGFSKTKTGQRFNKKVSSGFRKVKRATWD